MHFLIIDDHSLIVQALCILIRTKFPNAVIHTGASVDEARELVGKYSEQTDLLILDLNLPGVTTPTSFLESLVSENPTLKILVLSGYSDPENIKRVLKLGAAGFVPKSLETDTLTNAIEFVLKGGVYIPTRLLSDAQKSGFISDTAITLTTPTDSAITLTERQKEVLLLLARGLPIKGICRELSLSEGTVKTHVTSIYRAFGANNRTQALIAAQRAGFEISL